ncbi:MAG: hypothetical protein PUA77_08340 [Lachnospiraceae bacterium]|nr:hypothetical protein [Agathobacter sp.]MDD6291778.1 hypothetical protein [Lachnospiraceae bacterium]
MISRSGIIAYANRYAKCMLKCGLFLVGGVSKSEECDNVRNIKWNEKWVLPVNPMSMAGYPTNGGKNNGKVS